jgi:8-oxo-dGTP pyrophosphatase MutT (NUDIX family)
MIDGATLLAIGHRLGAELGRPEHSYRPLRVGREATGWLADARVTQLTAFTDVFAVRAGGIAFVRTLDTAAARTTALDRVARTLAADGLLTAWRDERYAVAPAFGAPPWFELERAAARYFGICTYAAHVNGLVRRGSDIAMWVARRSATKSIEPDRLDNLVAGGIAAGQSVASTVVKEAWEEAGIAAAVAAGAQRAGTVHICREQPDGLQRETIFVHDLWLAAEFIPAGQDGEVAGHRLVPLFDVGPLIANADGPDVVTADAALVMLDCLLRHGVITPDAPDYGALEALRHPPDPFASAAGA